MDVQGPRITITRYTFLFVQSISEYLSTVSILYWNNSGRQEAYEEQRPADRKNDKHASAQDAHLSVFFVSVEDRKRK